MSNIADIISAVVTTNTTTEEAQLQKLQLIRELIEAEKRYTSRIPAPANITEIGGYINLIQGIEDKQQSMLKNTLAEILGLSTS